MASSGLLSFYDSIQRKKIKINQNIQDQVDNLVNYRTAPVFGMYINDAESNPSSKITYVADSVGMTPAHMNYSTDKFDYGSWEDVWFIKETKPCILKQNGQVQSYLDKNDYSKDIDGNTVTIDSTLTGANVMIEFPKIWIKIKPDLLNPSSGYVFVSPVKIDDDYVDYPYIDYKGIHKEHFYMPAYNSCNIDNVLRSVSGATLVTNLTTQTEIDRAKANGNGWYTEDIGEVMLINLLLLLIGKSTDTQTVFGNGVIEGSQTEADKHKTGEGDTKGFFYGANNTTTLVKVFGIENWWGLRWRRYAGEILDNGIRKIKMCWGNEDGSSTFDFNITGDGYVDIGVVPSGTSAGYISKMRFISKKGMFSEVSSGSSSTHYCDGQWFNNAYHVIYAFRGGCAAASLLCGALCVALSAAPGYSYWSVVACVSYK